MDSTTMRAMGRQLLDLGNRLLDEATVQDALLSPDDIAERKRDNAATLGANYARSDEYPSADSTDRLRADLAHLFRGQTDLVEAGLRAAREVWRDRQQAA